MDPLLNYILRYDSLSTTEKIEENLIKVIPYSNKKLSDVSVNIITGKESIVKYTDIKKYTIINQAKEAFNDENYIISRDSCNPFEKIGNSIFINRAAIKLANIDAVFDLGKQSKKSKEESSRFTLLYPQSDEKFSFCDVAAGPGGFTQYLLYRYPSGQGCGMTLNGIPNLKWNTNKLDMERFEITYGKDNTGDLYKNWQEIVDLCNNKFKKVNLILGDGGIETEGSDDIKEFLSTRLFIVQCLVASLVLKKGGDACIKVFAAVNVATAQAIYLMSYLFEEIYLFKPVTSRPANTERYLICKGFSRENQELISEILMEANVDNVVQILDEIDEDFENWIMNENLADLAHQEKATLDILSHMGEDIIPDIMNKYNINKFMKILALP